MKHLLLLFFVLLVAQACYQQGKSTAKDKAAEYGSFDNYAFVLDGKVVEHQVLVDHPGSKLNKIFPYKITLEGREYRGAVYFNTPAHPVSKVLYADDPAYFINGTQVSPRNIRSLASEAYNRIEKTEKDTVIDDTPYKGAIHIETDEDFFSGCVAIPKLLDRYTDIPHNQIIVHWRGPSYRNESDIGIVIQDHFPIYYIGSHDPQSVEIDSIQFAEGERYIVQFVDSHYNKWGVVGGITGGGDESRIKAQSIFEVPLEIDTACPCCVTNFEMTDPDVFRSTEINPKPYRGEEIYLKKLRKGMKLIAGKPAGVTTSDSITVQFVVTKAGMLAGIESSDSDRPGHENILDVIKRYSCAWSPGIQSGFPRAVRRKMTIVYSRDQSGNIQTLDTLHFKM